MPIITGLNFFKPVNESLFNVGDGLAQCVLEANAAYRALGESLYAYEIGNEVDGKSNLNDDDGFQSLMCSKGWPGGSRRSVNWTIQDYVTQWNQYASVISQNLTGKPDVQLFQGCAFEAPRHIANRTDWNVLNAVQDGMHKNKAKTIADHDVSCLYVLKCKLLNSQ